MKLAPCAGFSLLLLHTHPQPLEITFSSYFTRDRVADKRMRECGANEAAEFPYSVVKKILNWETGSTVNDQGQGKHEGSGWEKRYFRMTSDHPSARVSE
ncbi:MAG: hypothetical protein ACLQAT_24495 [Candidatus Binataceae bacterium]